MSNAIEMRNLTKNYGKNRGIQEITMTVKRGDIFGYLGQNGAGKSTSIRCLLGLIYATSGEAYVLGERVGIKQKEILKKVGYMPSEAFFYQSMKVEEVIKYAAKIRKINCDREADKLCDRLEVDLKKKIGELSLGNRKKVSIVCALQHKPELIILDEPTSGLDPLMQEAFFELLLEHNRQGATCFLSSHVLPEVKRYCKNAAIIRNGRIIRVDSVENLTKTTLRKIKLSGVDTLPEIPGMTELKKGADVLTFSYQGEMKRLLEALQGLNVKDLLISEPSLEEAFMHFYEEGVE